MSTQSSNVNELKETGDQVVAPIIETVTAAWKAVLEKETVDIDDDFFSIGGNSISAVRITGRLREALDLIDLPLTLIFENPSVRELVDAIDEFRESATA